MNKKKTVKAAAPTPVDQVEQSAASVEVLTRIDKLEEVMKGLEKGQSSNSGMNKHLMTIITGVLLVLLFTLCLWLIDAFMSSQKSNLEMIQTIEEMDERLDKLEQAPKPTPSASPSSPAAPPASTPS